MSINTAYTCCSPSLCFHLSRLKSRYTPSSILNFLEVCFGQTGVHLQSRWEDVPAGTCTCAHTGTHVIKCFWVPHRNPSKATPRGPRSMAAADTWVCGWGKRTGAGQFFCNPVWSSCWVHHCLSPGGALALSITKWCHCHLIRFSGLEYCLEISPELTLNSAPAQNQTPAVEDLTELKWPVRCKPSLRC